MPLYYMLSIPDQRQSYTFGTSAEAACACAQAPCPLSIASTALHLSCARASIAATSSKPCLQVGGSTRDGSVTPCKAKANVQSQSVLRKKFHEDSPKHALRSSWHGKSYHCAGSRRARWSRRPHRGCGSTASCEQVRTCTAALRVTSTRLPSTRGRHMVLALCITMTCNHARQTRPAARRCAGVIQARGQHN
jgi:hypothetical protein